MGLCVLVPQFCVSGGCGGVGALWIAAHTLLLYRWPLKTLSHAAVYLCVWFNDSARIFDTHLKLFQNSWCWTCKNTGQETSFVVEINWTQKILMSNKSYSPQVIYKWRKKVQEAFILCVGRFTWVHLRHMKCVGVRLWFMELIFRTINYPLTLVQSLSGHP